MKKKLILELFAVEKPIIGVIHLKVKQIKRFKSEQKKRFKFTVNMG